MKLIRKAGATSEIWQVFIQDSSSTTGAGLTGLSSSSPSLTAYYHRDTDTTATAISLVTMTVGTFTSGGFKEIDATNMPGWYQFCPPNAAITSGAKSCGFHLKGAANMAPLPIEVDLVAYDPMDTVRLGLTALPNVASGSAGAIPTTGTGANQIAVDGAGNASVNLVNIAGAAVSNTTAQLGVNVVKFGATSVTGRDIGASVLLSAGTGTGQLDFTSGVVKANLAQILGTALTETAGQIAAAFKKFFNIATPASTMDALTLVATATNLTNAPTNGDLTAAMKTSVTTAATAATPTAAAVTGAVGSVTGAVGSVTGAVGSVTGNVGGNVVGSVGSVVGAVGSVTGLTASNLDATISSRLATSGYTSPPTAVANADALLGRNIAGGSSAGRTVTDALRFLRNKWSISGSTLTVTTEDDTTTAWTSTVTTDATAVPITANDPS